jgi:glycine oxidase
MSARPDSIVVGAGIVGATTARALAREGCRVQLLDAGPAEGAASPAAAGMLAPQIETGPGDPLLPLALAARDAYPALVAELEERGLGPLGYEACGIALVALDESRADELRRQARAQRDLGLEARWLERDALAQRHPGIAREALGALLAPRDSHVDPVALLAALLADGARLGVRRVSESVTSLLVEAGRVRGVRTERSIHHADAVVLAAGAWTPKIEGLPRPLPVEPVRGQMARCRWPRGEPRGVLFGRHAYVVPSGEHALLGSTMERAGFEVRTTAEGIRHIRTETGALLPALLTLPIERSWAGLRPMTPDGLPVLSRDPDVAGLVYATGHGRNGILLGPLSGEIASDLVLHGETRWPIAPYSIDRFSSGARRE